MERAFQENSETVKRVFLAIPLADYFLSEIRSLLSDLKSKRSGIRWELPEKVHVTLHFFGSAEDAVLDSICKAAAGLALKTTPFELTLNGLGFFPTPAQPRIVWLGIDGQVSKLLALRSGLEQTLAALGFACEDRKFHPHATLGRVKEKGIQAAGIQGFSRPSPPPRLIRKMVLFNSSLESTGSLYETLETFYFSEISPARG